MRFRYINFKDNYVDLQLFATYSSQYTKQFSGQAIQGFFLSGDYFMYMLDFCESVCNLKINTKQYNYKVRNMIGQTHRNLTLAKQKR